MFYDFILVAAIDPEPPLRFSMIQCPLPPAPDARITASLKINRSGRPRLVPSRLRPSSHRLAQIIDRIGLVDQFAHTGRRSLGAQFRGDVARREHHGQVRPNLLQCFRHLQSRDARHVVVGHPIPVVTVNAGDPIGSGFIKSLARPDGNITGLTNMGADISVKHLEMRRDMVPKLSHVAFMLNPENQVNFNSLRIIQAVAPKANIKILKVEASTPQEIDKAFIAMAREKVGAVIVTAHSLFLQQRRQIAELAAKYRLPSASARREQVEAGFMMSYGPNDADMFRRAAPYVDKIFKGAKPGDLPVEQPTKFEMFINGKTAKDLGLRIPQSLLISADKVIE